MEVSNNLSWSIEYFESNTAQCLERLKTCSNEIPLINLKSLQNYKDGELVRYRGMVQDMLNPEYYYSEFSIHNTDTGNVEKKSGKFRDLTSCKVNEIMDTGVQPEERQVLFCIQLPGISPWVRNSKVSDEEKQSVSTSGGVKRTIEEVEEVNNETSRKHKELAQSEPEQKCVVDLNLDNYYPIEEDYDLHCIIKLYEEGGESSILLNDYIEVVGFLSLNPGLEATWEDSDAEDKATHPPPSLVPRIHAISTCKLQHSNPLLHLCDETVVDAEQAFSDLRLVLTQVLYGDQLAADYLICHLLSRVYTRTDHLTLGNFSLNLYNVQSRNYVKRLYDIVRTLVTHSSFLPLTVESLNELAYVPKKDYETNRLVSGRLQLASGTHLVIDETAMCEGLLRERGFVNIQALQSIMRQQQVTYDFGFYPVTYNTEIPILVFSEGKTILDTGVQLKLDPDPSVASTIDETIDAALFFLNGELLERIRKYLTVMRLKEVEIDESLTSKVAEDYSELRRKDKVTPDDLHMLLVLARLIAVSQGHTKIVSADWEKAIAMDTERRVRIR